MHPSGAVSSHHLLWFHKNPWMSFLIPSKAGDGRSWENRSGTEENIGNDLQLREKSAQMNSKALAPRLCWATAAKIACQPEGRGLELRCVFKS